MSGSLCAELVLCVPEVPRPQPELKPAGDGEEGAVPLIPTQGHRGCAPDTDTLHAKMGFSILACKVRRHERYWDVLSSQWTVSVTPSWL